MRLVTGQLNHLGISFDVKCSTILSFYHAVLREAILNKLANTVMAGYETNNFAVN